MRQFSEPISERMVQTQSNHGLVSTLVSKLKRSTVRREIQTNHDLIMNAFRAYHVLSHVLSHVMCTFLEVF